jgi:16S rRNA (cytidine1402-2'-O)-methyltransferase
VKTLNDLAQYFGNDRRCSVSRELTKVYEENVRGSLQEVMSHFSEKTVKGEIVIILGGKNT